MSEGKSTPANGTDQDAKDAIWSIAALARDQGAIEAAVAALKKLRTKSVSVKAAIPLLEQASEDLWQTWVVRLDECTKVHR